MAKLNNLAGQKIDKLLVIEQAESRKKHTYWKCQCDCGNICEVSGEYLKRINLPRDCGCSKMKNIKIKKREEKFNRLIGQRFGKLTVVESTNQRYHNSIVWKCKCDCGNIKYVPTDTLRSGHTKSCGCLIREVQGNELTNQRFGKLIALYPCNYKKTSSILWHCKCDCGNECDVESYNLRSGHTSSCGCINRSIGELKIEELLLKNNISYKKEVSFNDLVNPNTNYKYRYDFGLYKNDILYRLIEFDGEQHFGERSGLWGNLKKDPYEKRRQRDKEKNEYALLYNIPLVRIPYWERNNITLEMIMGNKYLI